MEVAPDTVCPLNLEVKPLHQTAVNQKYLCIPSDESEDHTLEVFLAGEDAPILLLQGNIFEVTCCELSQLPSDSSDSTTYLCSGSSDSVYLWNVDECKEEQPDGPTKIIEGEQLLAIEDSSPVNACQFSCDNTLLAIAVRCQVHVVRIADKRLLYTLQGHTSPVSGVAFCFSDTERIISISQDRTFKLWNLESANLEYQSAIISAHAFLAIAIDPVRQRVAIGAGDGRVRIYDLGDNYRLVHTFDANFYFRKKMESKEGDGEGSDSIIGLHYCPTPPPASKQNHLRRRHQLPDLSLLLVVTTQYILHVDSDALDVLARTDLRASHFENIRGSVGLHPASSCSFANDGDKIHGCITHPFTPLATFFSLEYEIDEAAEGEGNVIEVSHALGDASLDDRPCSVFPSQPLIESSPLNNAEFQIGQSTPKAKVKNKPVTFHSKIKSSGYGSAAPVMQMFGGKPKGSKKKPAPSGPKNIVRNYPLDCKPPSLFQDKHGVSKTHNGAILSMCFSSDAHTLITASADKTLQATRLPVSKFEGAGTCFIAHRAPVNAARLSADSSLLLSASSDNTARLWNMKGQTRVNDPLLVISTQHNNYKEEKQRGQPFSSEVRKASFYYLDKFVMLSSGNCVYLYKYLLDNEKADDIKRMQKRHRYKLVHKFQNDCSSILDFTCMNNFHSYLTLCSGSNRSVEVWDMNTSSLVTVLEDVHNRPAHAISLAESSVHASVPQQMFDLFITSSLDGSVKLWDLRAKQCVHRYSSHVNRTHQLSASLSPCLRFLATGSEDNSAYIYDIRSGDVLHKLGGHSESVCRVAWNPLHPQMATACLDGTVRFFQSR